MKDFRATSWIYQMNSKMGNFMNFYHFLILTDGLMKMIFYLERRLRLAYGKDLME